MSLELFDFTAFQTNAENPTVLSLAFTLICALILSSLIALTYERTSRMVHRPDHFIQALVLASPVTTTIMLAIGDSVARGLGIIGALAIIRFRTNITDPRNILFIFASLAVGLACGVYRFKIGFVGTGFFCMAAFLLSWSPFNAPSIFLGELRFTIPEDGFDMGKVHAIMKTYCRESEIKRFRLITREELPPRLEYLYVFTLRRSAEAQAFRKALLHVPDLHDVRVTLEQNQPAI